MTSDHYFPLLWHEITKSRRLSVKSLLCIDDRSFNIPMPQSEPAYDQVASACLFWLLTLSCMSYPCILETDPLSIISFANVFSHSRGCLFIFYGFFCCAKTFTFNELPSVFLFPLGDKSEKGVVLICILASGVCSYLLREFRVVFGFNS